MQSAGRAVTSSPQVSFYSALSRPSRHAAADGLIRDANCTSTRSASSLSALEFTPKTAPLTVSATQKRFSSAKTRRTVSPPRSTPNDTKPNAAKPLVYKGRDGTTSNRNAFALSSNPYQHGRPSPNLTSGNPNSIFDQKIRRPVMATRETPSIQIQPPVQEHEPALPAESPSRPVRKPASQDLPDHVDHVVVPEAETAAERPVTKRDDEPSSRAKGRIPQSYEERASIFDEVLRLRRQKSELDVSLAQYKKELEELQQTHDRVKKSLAQEQSAHAQNMATKDRRHSLAIDAILKKENKRGEELVSTISNQDQELKALRTRLFDSMSALEAERQRSRRLEAVVRVDKQEQQAQATRQLVRATYNSFRAYAYEPRRLTTILLFDRHLLPREIEFLQRETVYWNNALRSIQTFENSAKSGDDRYFWEAGEQIQKKTRDAKEQEDLRQNFLKRLQHRDSVFAQIKAYLRNSSLESDTTRRDRTVELESLQECYMALSRRQHDHRRAIRNSRYDLDPKTGSPEASAYSRASTVDYFELDRPLRSMVEVFNSLRKYWIDKRKTHQSQDNQTSHTAMIIKSCGFHIAAVAMCHKLVKVLRAFSIMQMEAKEAMWVSEKSTYQQLSWQTRTRIARRQNQPSLKVIDCVRQLRSTNFPGDHRILAPTNQQTLHNAAFQHGEAAFTYAYVKDSRNDFTDQEKAEIQRVNETYITDNFRDLSSFMRQIEDSIRSLGIHLDDRRTSRTTLGKRSLVPARSRRSHMRKAASAQTKHVEEESKKNDLSAAKSTASDSTTQIPRSAAGAAMTSKDTDSESFTSSAGDGASQSVHTTTGDAEEKTSAQLTGNSPGTEEKTSAQLTGNSPGTEEKTSAQLTGNSPGTEVTSDAPTSKSASSPAPIPRLVKSAAIYSRTRSRLAFKPPKPIFKETRRTRFEASMSSADFFDKEELSQVSVCPPLLYQIPPRDLRAALMASKTSQAAFWRYSLYKSPSGEKPVLHYCTRLHQAEQVAKLFLEEKLIGFDIEWEMGSKVATGSIKDNVSLIQIACDNRIALFQVALFIGEKEEDLMPPTLKAILESDQITKAGVNIGGDFTRLRKCLGVEGRGIFELSHLYKLVKFSGSEPAKVNKKPFRLADQVQNVLFLPLHKGSVRTSAWSKRLSMEQVEYAASDAYAGLRIFQELDMARETMRPVPPRPAFWELDQPIILGDGRRHDEVRVERKAGNQKASKAGSKSPALSPEEEQALRDEEEEAEAEAEADTGVEDTEDANVEDEANLDYEAESVVEYEAADQWLGQWSKDSSDKKGKATPTSIRAYALWHVQGLTLQQVAEAMRQPPLAQTTVASYVLGVVKSESLPYESAKLQEALDTLPPVAHWRYKSLIQKTRSEV